MLTGERIIGAVCGLLAVASVGVFAMNTIRNPMHSRLAVFEEDLGKIRHVAEDFAAPDGPNYEGLVKSIVWKRTLWAELIAPPPKKARPKSAPNLAKMLEGVAPSARHEIGRGDTVKIKIMTLADPRGSWYGVGDELNGLTIVSIDDGQVEFGMKKNGEEHRHALRRR